MSDGMPMVELKIWFDGKQTQVAGPIGNEMLCQTLLDQAAHIIHDYNVNRKLQAAQQTTPTPQPGVIVPKRPTGLHLA